MKRLILIPILLLSILCNAQFTKGGGMFLKTGSGFMTAPAVADTLTYQGVIGDGNTVGWYIADADNLTVDGSNNITAWEDLSSESNDLSSEPGYYPVWDSANEEADFTGLSYIIKGGLTISQPLMIYMVVRINTIETNKYYIRLSDGSSLLGVYTFNSYPMLYAFDGISYIAIDSPTSLTEGTYYIIRALFNGTTSNGSKIVVNEDTAETGTLYDHTVTTIGFAAGVGNDIKMSVKEWIYRNVAEDSDDETIILNYLNSKYSVY